jgi:3-deoxy-D-manno-octulosonic-acid transferase
MHLLLRFLYVIFSYLLVPLVLLHLFWKGLGNRDYWGRIGERFGWFPGPKLNNVIWLHAVSVGEVQAAAPLVRELLKRYPQYTVLVTTMTPTGSDRVRSLFANQVVHVYVPFDLDWPVKRFFDWCNPRLALILETELWPNLYHECGEREIPLVLASARVSAKSVGRYRWLVSLFKKTLSHGIVIAAQTPVDAERFVSIGASAGRAHVTGNIKFDFELPAGIVEQGCDFKLHHAADRAIWVAASTHAGEEEIALAAHQRVLEKFPHSLLILVPRHPERFDGIAAMLDRQKVTYTRRSTGETCNSATAVLLGDTMGELMVFYAAADIAFVGGSLVKVGGHNLLEPAALRLPMITGPYTYNAEDVAELLQTGGALSVVNDAESLANAVTQLLGNSAERDRQGEDAAALIERNRGALERLLKLLEPLLLC